MAAVLPTIVRNLGGPRSSEDGRPAYVAVADGIRQLVHDGRIPVGESLPSERSLASALTLSRTTVTAAYQRLRELGYLTSRQGARSVVEIPAGARGVLQPYGADVIDLDVAASPSPPTALAGMLAAALDDLTDSGFGTGLHPAGLASTRAAVAGYYTREGLTTAPEQILVTSGAQQAIRLVLEALVAPGDRVIAEHPGYANAFDAIERARGRVTPLPLDVDDPASAWDVGTVTRLLRRDTPRLLYTVPDFHNPTGLVMPEDTRRELVDLARRAGTTLLVDESLRPLGIDAPAPRRMAEFGNARTVITIGSLSKPVWAGLRIGWIRADRELVARLALTRAALDLASAPLEQYAANRALAAIDAVSAERVEMLRECRTAAVAAVRAELPGASIVHGLGGLCLWVRLPEPLATAVAIGVRARGVRISPGTRFGADGGFDSYLRIPYGLPPATVVEGVRRIGETYRGIAGADIGGVELRSVVV